MAPARRGVRSATHPVLWLAIVVLAGLTTRIATSPLTVILDACLHDDSFYYLATARNLADGFGSTFDRVNHTNGYQPAWFAVLTALALTGIGPDEMVRVGLALQAACFGAGLVVLAVALVRSGVQPLAASAAVATVYVALVPALAWDLLETGLNVLTSAGVLWALGRQVEGRIAPTSLALVLSAAVLARTDHVFFLPIGAALVAWPARRETRTEQVRRGLAFLLPIVAIVGGYLLLNLFETGHVVPISGRVKAWLSVERRSLGAVWIEWASFDVRQIWKVGVAAALAFVARDAWRRHPTGIGAYSLGAIAIVVYYVWNHTPGFSLTFWYYVPLYGVLTHAAAAALQRALDHRGLARRAVVPVVSVAVVALMAARVWTVENYRSRGEGERAEMFRLAGVLRGLTAGRDVRVGAWDAGILGYYAGPVTNLDGLINSAEYFDRYYSKGRTLDYIREVGFDYIVCYEGYLRPGRQADGLLADYQAVFKGWDWVILERRSRSHRPGFPRPTAGRS